MKYLIVSSMAAFLAMQAFIDAETYDQIASWLPRP